MTLKLQQYSLIIAIGLATTAPAFADNHDPYEPYNRFMYRINGLIGQLKQKNG